MRNDVIISLLLIMLLFCIKLPAQQPQWVDPNQGRFKVGFKTMLAKDRNQKPILISIWYPAESGTDELTISELIVAQKMNDEPDSQLINRFKSIIELIYDLRTIDESNFAASISSGVKTYQQAKMRTGKLPLVIARADPSSYYSLFQFLASHGFVVAGVYSRHSDYPMGANYYKPFVDELEDLLNIMATQSFIDSARISAFGHGGGIQAAAYLAMRTPRIKKVVNLDGGFFVPRSNTTISSDYHPENLNVPFLHIVTQEQRKLDDEAQIRVLKNPLFRVTIKTDLVWHHDFTSFGRVAGEGLKLRKPIELISQVINACDTLVLQFLSGHVITNEKDAFEIEKLN